MPITKAIIWQVHQLAELDKMPKGLKIQNRTNVVLFDSAKTAEVDYSNEFITNNEDNDVSNEDDNNNASDNEDNPDSDDEGDDDDPDGEVTDDKFESTRLNTDTMD
eukprot:7050706-Ditylum_brightwellii.AAC.1